MSAATQVLSPRGVWPYVAFTGLVFGAGTLLVKKFVDDGIDPLAVTWIPFTVGGIVALVMTAARREVAGSAVIPAALLGVTAITPALLFNLGFERLPAGIVTLLISLGPAVTAVIAHFAFADERFNRTKAVGLAVAIAGVAILAAGSLGGEGSGVGILIVVAGTVVAGFSAVFTRKLTLVHSPASMIGTQLLVGGLFVLAAELLLGRQMSPDSGFASWHVPALLAFGVATFLGFLSMLKANVEGTTGQVSIIGYFVPLLGVLGGIIIFDDPVTVSLIVGGTLILIAMTAIARGSESTHPT